MGGVFLAKANSTQCYLSSKGNLGDVTCHLSFFFFFFSFFLCSFSLLDNKTRCWLLPSFKSTSRAVRAPSPQNVFFCLRLTVTSAALCLPLSCSSRRNSCHYLKTSHVFWLKQTKQKLSSHRGVLSRKRLAVTRGALWIWNIISHFQKTKVAF